MAKFNRKPTVTEAATAAGVPLPTLAPNHSALAAPAPADAATKAAINHEGAPGFLRTPEGELFMLGVVNMVGEDSYYESAEARDSRFADLVRKVAVTNPEWLVNFIGWLRGTANMRSASGMAAVEMVMARAQAKLPGYGRKAISNAAVRADEPGEMLAYWLNRYAPDGGKGSKSMPAALRRGLADAIVKLYSERNFIKYDSDKAAVRWGDVIDLVNPTTFRRELRGTRGDLLKHAIDVRHGRDNGIPESLDMLNFRAGLLATPAGERRETLRHMSTTGRNNLLRRAGMTWEQLAGWLPGGMDREAWEWVIPQMGYMATLRNLRNFDKAGVPDDVAQGVADRLADPEQVAKSRQFPYRFLSAYLATDTERWRVALEKALQASVANVPSLPGRTLVLVDTSGSMGGFSFGGYSSQTGVAFSGKSKITPMMAGALFGVALAAKGEQVDLYGFANGNPFRHIVRQGASVLRETEKFCRREGEDGHGTRIAQSVRATFKGKGESFKGHDRVVIVTDMQTFGADRYGVGPVGSQVPAEIPMYAFNLGGYQVTGIDTSVPNRYELGGLTDSTFRIMGALESGVDGLMAIDGTPAALTP